MFFLALSIGVINTLKHVKTLSINHKYLVIKTFGVIRSKPIKINYSDILHLEYSSDEFGHFIFTLKNGEEEIIRTDIKEKDKAFKLIQQKLLILIKTNSIVATSEATQDYNDISTNYDRGRVSLDTQTSIYEKDSKNINI